MQKTILFSLILTSLLFAGCTLANKVAPAQYDDNGQEIPFSRQPTEFTQAVAHTVPYGDVVLNGLLAIWGTYMTFKKNKTEKGLKATLLAGKQAASDPKVQEAWNQIKDYYRIAHDSAGVTGLIKSELAKLPSIPDA